LAAAKDAAGGRLKKAIGRVMAAVEAGSPLSVALGGEPRIFSGIITSAVYAGEQSGNLSVNFSYLAEVLERERALQSKIRGAMTYPLIVLVVAIVLGLLLAFVLLPKITPLFEGLKIDLPLSTRVLIWLSDVVQNYGGWLIASLVGLVIIVSWLARRRFTEAARHWLALKLPVLRQIVLNNNLARFARTLGLLLKSGLNIDEALEITRKTLPNFHYRRVAGQILSEVGRGVKLSDNLERFPHLFPPLFARVVRVGEGSGKFEESFNYLADYYGGEADRAAKNISTALEPLLLIGIGLVVAGLALSIITPIYELTGNVRR